MNSRVSTVGLWFLVLVLTLGLAACQSSSSGGGQDDALRTKKPWNPDDFEIEPDQGEAAEFANLDTDLVSETYFKKRYDRADLNAILRASSVSTTEYIKRLGVQLYRIERPEPRSKKEKKPPVFFFNLEAPPDDLQYVWDYVTKEFPAGTLAGLYFDSCLLTESCSEFKVVTPVILVDEAQHRWTLIHELMHHVFNAQRKADKFPDVFVLKNRLENSKLRIEKWMADYKKIPNRDDLMQAALELDNMAHITHDRLAVKEFEEAAVEGLLLDEWASGRLKYVIKDGAYNAVWYMNANRTAGMPLLEEMYPHLQTALREAQLPEHNWPEVIEQLKKTQAYIAEIRRSSRDMVLNGQNITGTKLEDEILPLHVKSGLHAFDNAPEAGRHDCVTSEKERQEWLKVIRSMKSAFVL